MSSLLTIRTSGLFSKTLVFMLTDETGEPAFLCLPWNATSSAVNEQGHKGLSQIMRAVGTPMLTDSDELLGKSFVAEVNNYVVDLDTITGRN